MWKRSQATIMFLFTPNSVYPSVMRFLAVFKSQGRAARPHAWVLVMSSQNTNEPERIAVETRKTANSLTLILLRSLVSAVSVKLQIFLATSGAT